MERGGEGVKSERDCSFNAVFVPLGPSALSNVSGASVEVTPKQTRMKARRNICSDIFAITCGYVNGLILETWEYA